MVMVRWSVVSIILVCLRSYSSLQILLNLILSFLYQCFIINGKPLPEVAENRMLIFNESMVSLYLYALMMITDFNLEEYQFEDLGLFLLSIVMFSLLVNIIRLIYLSITNFYRKIKECRRKKAEEEAVVAIKPTTKHNTQITGDDVFMSHFHQSQRKVVVKVQDLSDATVHQPVRFG